MRIQTGLPLVGAPFEKQLKITYYLTIMDACQ